MLLTCQQNIPYIFDTKKKRSKRITKGDYLRRGARNVSVCECRASLNLSRFNENEIPFVLESHL